MTIPTFLNPMGLKLGNPSPFDGITYTGAYTVEEAVMSGGIRYALFKLTASGTLTVKGSFIGDVWLCGGGQGGNYGGSPGNGIGGRGGYIYNTFGVSIISGAIIVGNGGSGGISASAVGALGGHSTYNSLSSALGIYGSGGGAGRGGTFAQTSGGGVSTIPFLDTTMRREAAGGGGSGVFYNDDVRYRGGAGGTNGGNGAAQGSVGVDGGLGGVPNGGNGGYSYSIGLPGTQFGGGGGGGGADYDSNTLRNGGPGGPGGIMIRIRL